MHILRPLGFLALWVLFLVGLVGSCGPQKGAPDGGAADGGGKKPPTSRVDTTSTGSKSADFLTDSTYKSLLIEIDYQAAAKPSQRLLDTFKQSLESLRKDKHLRKPGGIELKLDQEIPDGEGGGSWDVARLRKLEEKYRQNLSGGTQAVAYFLFVAGKWHEDTERSKVLGVAYSGSTMTMFLETIQSSCSGAGVPLFKEKLCNIMESTTMVHEFGHILGLVNIGLELSNAHEDQGHKGHCSNKDCVMYWTNNKSSMADALKDILSSAPPVIPFGKECLDDMAAVHK